MKKKDYEKILINEYRGDIGRIASRVWCYEINYIRRNRETNLTFTRMLRSYLYNHIAGVENPASPSSLLDPTIIVLMYDVFKEYKRDSNLKDIYRLVSETKEVVKRLDDLITNVEAKKSIAEEELSDLENLCKIITRQADARRPAIGMGISVHCP